MPAGCLSRANAHTSSWQLAKNNIICGTVTSPSPMSVCIEVRWHGCPCAVGVICAAQSGTHPRQYSQYTSTGAQWAPADHAAVGRASGQQSATWHGSTPICGQAPGQPQVRERCQQSALPHVKVCPITSNHALQMSMPCIAELKGEKIAAD